MKRVKYLFTRLLLLGTSLLCSALFVYEATTYPTPGGHISALLFIATLLVAVMLGTVDTLWVQQRKKALADNTIEPVDPAMDGLGEQATTVQAQHTKARTARFLSAELSPRAGPHSGWFYFGWHLIVLLILFWILNDTQWLWPMLGVKRIVPLWQAAVLGFGCYLIFLGLWSKVKLPWLTTQEAFTTNYNVARMFLPRSRLQTCILSATLCVLNPVTEEVLFRGILIHFTGTWFGWMLPAVLLGAFCSFSAHLYQGRAALPYQFAFHLTSVGILFTPLGLLGCIGFHFGGDLIPLMRHRKVFAFRIRQYRNRHKSPSDAGTSCLDLAP